MTKYLKKYLWLLFPVFFSALMAISSTLLLIPLSRKLPELFAQPSFEKLLLLCLAVILIYIFRGFFSYLQNYLTGYISVKTTADLRKEIYRRLLEQSPEYLEEKRSGDLLTLLTDDLNKLRDYLFTLISEFIPSLFTIFLTLSYVFYLNWRLSIFALILVPVIGFLISFFSEKIKKRAENIQNRIADGYSLIQENFVNFPIIKVFTLESRKNNFFSYLEDRHSRENLEAIRLISLQPAIIGVVQTIGIAAIACYGGWQIINGKLSLADLLAFGTALSITVDPVIYLTKSSGIMNMNKVSRKRIEKFYQSLASKPQRKDEEISNLTSSDPEKNRLICKNVSFRYSDKTDFSLKEINFSGKRGETIALIGENGSGKSTLIKLLLGFYENYQGEINIFGTPLKNQNDFSQKIRASFHESFLFNQTIRDNILNGLSEKVENENDLFAKVTEITGIDQVASELPGNYDYLVGDGGNKLSSGQKQRLAISRAIISRPEILILDEATSAIDPESEQRIYQKIRHFLPQTTIILINHRFNSLKNFADSFYLIKDGQIEKITDSDKIVLSKENYGK